MIMLYFYCHLAARIIKLRLVIKEYDLKNLGILILTKYLTPPMYLLYTYGICAIFMFP